MRSWQKAIGSLLLAGILSVPAYSAPRAGSMAPAQPGTLNYIEGQASIDSQPLNQNSVGNAGLQPGQTLATQNGRVEVLLTPGVFLRVADNSAVRMDSPGLSNTAVTLQSGRAMVEVAEILPANNLVVTENGAGIRLDKRGVYDFDANRGVVRVFDGEATVTVNNQNVKVKGGHEFAFNAPKLKAQGFDKTAGQDDFYRWSSLRASYLAEANVNAARLYANGYGWNGPGWYWDPYFTAYTWIPGDGIFWSPFGWGFYSPWLVGYAPYYGFGYRGGYFHTFGPGYHPPVAAARGFTSPRVSPGFRGGFSGAVHAGGGFHGGGGRR
jgi:hypothetical protein